MPVEELADEAWGENNVAIIFSLNLDNLNV
jgi:hypothetical protein